MKKISLISSFEVMGRLLKQLKGDKVKYFFSAFLSMLEIFGINAANAYGMLFIFRGLEQSDASAFKLGIALIIGLNVLFIIINYVGNIMFQSVVAKLTGRLKRDIFSHVCRLPVAWFENHHSGDILSRLTNDLRAAENAWGGALIFPLSGLVAGIGSAIVMITIDPLVGVVAIIVGTAMLLLSSKYIKPMKKCSDESQEEMSVTTQRFVDILASSKVARMFNLQLYLIEKLNMISSKLYKTKMKSTYLRMGQVAVNMVGSQATNIGLMLIGGILVVNGKTTFSNLIAISSVTNGINAMFWILSSTLSGLQESIAGAERVLNVLDTPIEENEAKTSKCEDVAVELERVSFSYEEGTLILDEINECIRKGETVALVGGSGGGKSTILKLAMGFYQPDDGDISVMGDNPRDTIAYVPQTNYLFSGTIRENIAYGKDGATDNEIIEAAKAAMAHDFIMEMPDGYDTVVGERGSRLSGGQRQRIAIARAICKNVPILLLDEATSALDSEAERLVQKAIDKLIEGRTSIIVAHRLSTIRHADRILVLEGGKVVEKGEHNELLEKNGRYAYYYNLQFDSQKAS